MQGQQNNMVSNQMPGQQPQYQALNIQKPAHAEPQEWETGLCACCSDCKVCCFTAFCPCIQYGRVYEKVHKSGCVSQCVLFSFLAYFGLSCLIHKELRHDIRHKHNIKKGCNDCLVVCFCPSCALCQEARELKHHEYKANNKL